MYSLFGEVLSCRQRRLHPAIYPLTKAFLPPAPNYTLWTISSPTKHLMASSVLQWQIPLSIVFFIYLLKMKSLWQPFSLWEIRVLIHREGQVGRSCLNLTSGTGQSWEVSNRESLTWGILQNPEMYQLSFQGIINHAHDKLTKRFGYSFCWDETVCFLCQQNS